MGGNLSMLNLSENWANMSGVAGHHQGFLTGGAPSGVGMGQSVGSQYPGMWMSSAVGNLTNVSQSCAMPYLRTTAAPYSLPVTASNSPSPASSGVGTLQTSPSSASMGGQSVFEHPCDLGAYSRDHSRASWSPLTPPPL